LSAASAFALAPVAKKYMDRDCIGVGDRQFFGHTHFAERSLQVRVLGPGPGHKLNAFSAHRSAGAAGNAERREVNCTQFCILVLFSVNLAVERKKEPAEK